MNEKYIPLFNAEGLHFGRCVGSKSSYREGHPDHLIVFNCRIYLKSTYEKLKDTKIRDFFKGQEDEIWYGDIDFNLDIFKLYNAYMKIEEALVVCNEMGNKIIEIGDDFEKIWVGTIGNQGLTLKDFKSKFPKEK